MHVPAGLSKISDLLLKELLMRVITFRLNPDNPVVPPDSYSDGGQTLVLAFFAPEIALNPAPLQLLRTTFPQSYLLGCSTAGEILGTNLDDRSVVVTVLTFASTSLGMAKAEIADITSSREAGESLGHALSRPDLKGVFVLSDGLNVNGTELAHGLNGTLPGPCLCYGRIGGRRRPLRDHVYLRRRSRAKR